MRPAAQAAPQRQACAAISRPASMPLITKDAPEVAVDRGDEQCALDRCESNASRRCGCARQGAGLHLRSQSSAQVGQNCIRNRQQPFRVATRAVTLWPQRGSCVATAGSEGQRTRWGSSGRAAVLARAAERAPRRARRPPVSKMGEQTVQFFIQSTCGLGGITSLP